MFPLCFWKLVEFVGARVLGLPKSIWHPERHQEMRGSFLSLSTNWPIAEGYFSSPFVIPWAKSLLTQVTKQLQKGGEHQQCRGSSTLIFGLIVPVYAIYHVAEIFIAVYFQCRESF